MNYLAIGCIDCPGSQGTSYMAKDQDNKNVGRGRPRGRIILMRSPSGMATQQYPTIGLRGLNESSQICRGRTLMFIIFLSIRLPLPFVLCRFTT